MRILVVSPWLPEPPHWGSGIRLRELLRGLSRKHSVTLVAYMRDWEAEHLPAVRELCEEVHPVIAGWPEGADRAGRIRSLFSARAHSVARLAQPDMKATVRHLIDTGRFDLVQVESSHLAALDFSGAAATVLDEHNVEYEQLARSLPLERSAARRAFGALEYVKVLREERRAWRRFDAVAVPSERELDEVRRFNAGRPAAVVANGVDLEHFAPQPETAEHGLVFTGLMRFRPNIDAVTYFVKDVLPLIRARRPEVTFTIVGWGTSPEVEALLGPGVTATGRVPDVRPYLAGAAAVVAPIRMGSGTRLKVLEALAMGRPLVATAQACEGLDLVDGRDLAIADSPRAFADAVLRVLENPRYAARLGESGRSQVTARFGWDSSVAQLEELHDVVLAGKGGGRKASIVRGLAGVTAPRSAAG